MDAAAVARERRRAEVDRRRGARGVSDVTHTPAQIQAGAAASGADRSYPAPLRPVTRPMPADARAARAYRMQHRRRRLGADAQSEEPIDEAAVERARVGAYAQRLTDAQRMAAHRALLSPSERARLQVGDAERRAIQRATQSPSDRALQQVTDAERRAVNRVMLPADTARIRAGELQALNDARRQARAARDAPANNADSAERTLDAVLAATHNLVCRPVEVPRQWSDEDEVVAASKLRDAMEARIPDRTCAVCARRRTDADCTSLPVADLPNLQLLSAVGPQTDECLRDAMTTYNVEDQGAFCLDPEGALARPRAR